MFQKERHKDAIQTFQKFEPYTDQSVILCSTWIVVLLLKMREF